MEPGSNTDKVATHKSKTGNTSFPPLSLPSLFLCPHHTFLASLILALKFMQDSKLSDLPPHEIGWCESTLRGVLKWHPWVDSRLPAMPSISSSGQKFLHSGDQLYRLEVYIPSWMACKHVNGTNNTSPRHNLYPYLCSLLKLH
ncbi:hypothetical protein HD554DRAFT_2013288 [Boletus coccyginus]|nr:hypothetical protein HD554DRAFT_2013288 [Boletus coccyginus]